MEVVYFVSKYKVEGVDNYATLSDCVEYLKDKDVLGLDIETSKNKEAIGQYREGIYKGGLDPYLTNIVMIQIGDLERIYVIDARDFTREELQPLITFLHWNKETEFVTVNGKFECKHLKHKYDTDFYKIYDCMVVEMCLCNGLPDRSYSLAGLAKRYLGVGEVKELTLFADNSIITMDDDILINNEHAITPFEVADNEAIDKSTRLEFINIGDRPFTAKQILYGSDDIKYPLLIRERQLQGRKLPNGEIYAPHKLFNLENNLIPVLAEIELSGLPISTEKWMDLADVAKEEWLKRMDELNNYVKQFYHDFVEPPNLFNFEPRCTIEWGSSQQVIKLFRKLDICPQEFSKQTKRREYTVGAVALMKQLPNDLKEAYNRGKWTGFEKDGDGKYIENNDLLILNYLLMKKSEQLGTTFGAEFLKYVHPITGKLHAGFRQILNSGRMATSKPNINNIPKGVYRDPFCVTEGVLIFADYSSQELRTSADLAQDKNMLDFFIKGHPVYKGDLHTYTANLTNRIHNPSAPDLPPATSPLFTPEMVVLRNRTKVLEFGIIYGKQAKGFSDDFGVSEEEAQELIDGFLGAYPGIRDAMKYWFDESMEKGYIQIDKILDRRWFSPHFEILPGMVEEIRAYYPSEYWKWGTPKEEKERMKEEVYEMYPEVKDMWKEFFAMRGAIQRKSTNYRVQGTSANQTKASLILVWRRKIENGYTDLTLINSIHDEIGMYCENEENAEKYAKLLEDSMADGGNLMLHNKIMTASAEIGKSWIH